MLNFFILLLSFSIVLSQEHLAFAKHSKNASPKIKRDLPPVVLDGNVTDEEWSQSRKINSFKQISPSLGNPTSEKTDAFIRYDKDYLYIAIKAYDSNPENVFASVLGRDEDLTSDDYVQVIIDTYNDKTNALGFMTNPLSTRRDFEISNNGNSSNASWNTFWDVTAQKTSYGWSAEYQIPFSSLRYEIKNKNSMGFKIIRYIRGKNETVMSPLNNDGVDNVQWNLINSENVDFIGLEEKKPIYFTPYITSDYSSLYELNDSETEYLHSSNLHSGKNFVSQKGIDQILSNLGFDLKYKINNNNTLDLTMNTDFAQAEADNRVINLSRFSVFLPEKRGFFLENADLFNFQMMFGNKLFHSRRIGIEDGVNVPVIGGARLTGSQNGFSYGLLNLQTKSIESEDIEAKNYSVARVKKALSGDESYIGAIFTNKQSTQSSAYNRVYGLDGKYLLGNNFRLLAYVTASDEQGSIPNNMAYGIRLNKSSSTGYSMNLVYSETNEDFNSELGFIRRSDNKRVGMWNGWGWNFKESKLFSSYDLGLWTAKSWHASTNENADFGMNIWTQVTFKNGLQIMSMPFRVEIDYLNEPWEFSDDITIPAGRYKVNKTFYRINTGNSEAYQFSLVADYAGFYDGTKLSLSPNINYILNEKFSFDLGLNYNKIKLPNEFSTTNNTSVTRTLISTKLNYSFSAYSSLKALVQYDNDSETIGSNIRFRYNPTEGTDLFLVYNTNMNLDRYNSDVIKPSVQNQAVILKFSKTFTY